MVPVIDARPWRAAWPGLCATLVPVGLGRFSYTPLIPLLIAQHVLSETEAAYLGAANLLGYLVGAAGAATIARRLGMARAVRLAFVAATVSLALCVPQLGFWWFLPWRVLIGIASAVLMVLGPSLMLIETRAGERGRAGGLVYTGVGLGTAFGSLAVPPLAAVDTAWAWGVLALAAGAMTTLSWRRWHGEPSVAVASSRRSSPLVRADLAVLSLVLAFTAEGGGFVPHTLFWVDFIARELGLGIAIGQLNWLLFALGAMVGPFVTGAVGDRIGLGNALVAFFAIKALAVFMPVASSAPLVLAVSSVLVGALSPGLTSILSARLSRLVEPADQAPLWAIATLGFSLLQATSAYGLSFLFAQTGTYRPLYAIGGSLEALGTVLCIIAWHASRVRTADPRRPASHQSGSTPLNAHPSSTHDPSDNPRMIAKDRRKE